MIGNRRNFPTALVVPNFDNLEKWAQAQGLGYAGREELVRDAARSRASTTRRCASCRRDLAKFERIKKLALLPREFTLEAGELTPTLKVKRRFVEQKYQEVIDRMYEGDPA